MSKYHQEESSGLERGITTVAVIAMLALAAALLVILVIGGTPNARQLSGTSLDVVDRFFVNASNAISDASPSTVNVSKTYRISGNSAVAPKPDKSRYGKVDTPAQMTEIIAASANLLDGQSMYFSTVSDVYDKYGVEYYQDDSILAVTWKQSINSTMYTFSEVKLADASQFRRYLSGGKYGSGKLVYATEMAGTVHAVVASSGDYFEYRSAGIIVYNGTVCRVGYGADTCFIDKNGDLIFSPINQQMDMETAQKFVDDNQIQFSLAFGPILVENGQAQSFGGYPLGEIGDQNSRAALCQMGKLHYMLINACDEDGHTRPTMYEFAKHVVETGCDKAYALDGGQTTALVMNDVLVNHVVRGYQRKISDIIYFATAIPNS